MLTHFLKDCRGGIAPMLALLALPLMGAVGVAVDYSRANATRTAFQAALDSTALMLSKTAATQSAADLQTAATNYFNALFVAPRSQQRRDYRHLFLDRRVEGDAHRQRHHQHEFPRRARLQPDQHRGDVGIDLGQHPAAGRARARQHRLDVEQRQDDRAEDRVAKSAHAAQERGRERWRRLCLDRPVQQGRERRRQQLHRVLAALGPVGCRERHLQQFELPQAEQLPVAQQDLDAGQPQHLERLRHRSRPEFRHHQRCAGRRRHAVSGRAVFVVPACN